ncbi:molybdenum cofactor guanylyltransferase [Demequina sp. SO4-18]|uniref:molybdenum cofactor guanylyltransferase n=1 Tax=Demequina sp. SO4-18 TaxID=3401026 RepID=UPI003B5C4E9E
MRTGAIVLTGGGARRLGGTDKASVEVGGSTLLSHALSAAASCAPVVVVGPTADAPPGVTFAREEPAGGGPVAGIAAGLHALDLSGFHDDVPSHVLVLACDMPHAREAVPALMAAVATQRHDDGAWGVDPAGRRQPLLALYRRESLRRALEELGEPQGASMRALASGLTMMDVPVGHAARDADTWDDVLALREEWA